MLKIKKSPFVQKVQGKRNWIMVDFLNEHLFHITRDSNDIDTLKKQLLERNLVHEVKGIIPFDYRLDIRSEYVNYRKIRTLQVRVTGECDERCPECGICGCMRGTGIISDRILDRVIEQVKSIPPDQLVITGGNPFKALNKLERLLHEIRAKKYIILFQGAIPQEAEKLILKPNTEIKRRFKEMIPAEEKMKADPFTFFYQQLFNPCWGHSVAVDLDGKIKPCLWSGNVTGNINDETIPELIDRGTFDVYWELSKNKIESCLECEYRYCCRFDCRVIAQPLNARYHLCGYNPGNGIWENKG